MAAPRRQPGCRLQHGSRKAQRLACCLALAALLAASPAAAQAISQQQLAQEIARAQAGLTQADNQIFGQQNQAPANPQTQGKLGTQGKAVVVQNEAAGDAANRLGFTDRDTLPPNGGYAVYNFETKEPGLGIPDVLLTVKSSPASAAMYCNPAWLTIQDEGNQIAGPQNALFQFENDLPVGNIYLAADNAVTRPPSARLKGTAAYDQFTPAYNCTVINYDTDLPAHYTFAATFNFHDVKLNAQEQDAIKSIWEGCCQGRTREADLRVRDSSASTNGFLDPALTSLTCGQWVAVNEANAVTPFLDFCNVVGNACSQDGHLTQLNMNGWNLGGTFPAESLARFSALTEVDLSNNPNMKGNMRLVFNSLATLKNLQVVDFTGDQGFSGTFAYERTPENNQRSALCVVAEGGLRILNMADTGLYDLQMPDCLMGPHSTLEEVRLGSNGLVGSIPDNFDDTSPIQYLSLRGNELTGTIPSTLGLAGDLSTVDLAGNQFQGTIPANLGHPRRLRFVHLGFNKLTGGIPNSLALHDTVEALDVHNNDLTQVPTDWLLASDALIAQSPLVYLRIAENLFEGPFPQTLAKLPKLAVLAMQGNNFRGQLPAIKGMFPALRYFDASYNNFTGFIPEQWSDCGIIRLKPTEAALIKQFQPNTSFKDLENTGRATFQQVFNMSGNYLSGPVPIWLWNDNMPTWARAGIDIHNNNLTIDCSAPLPTQLEYLTQPRACPQYPSAAALAAVRPQLADKQGVAAPEGAAPRIAPEAAPAVVKAVVEPALAPASFIVNSTAPIGATSDAPAYDAALARDGRGTTKPFTQAEAAAADKAVTGGGGGTPKWAKAVIAIGVLIIVALAAAVAWLCLRRTAGHERGFIHRFAPVRPSGFSKFEDAMENGNGNGNVQMSARNGDSPARKLDFNGAYTSSNFIKSRF